MKRSFDLCTRRWLGTAAIARKLAAEQALAPPAGLQPAVVQPILDNEAYLGGVIWRQQSLPGLHEPLHERKPRPRRRRLDRKRW